MEILLLTLPLLVPIVWANFSERHRLSPYVIGYQQRDRAVDLLLRHGPYVLLGGINLAILAFVGLALLNQVATMLMPETMPPQTLATNWLGRGRRRPTDRTPGLLAPDPGRAALAGPLAAHRPQFGGPHHGPGLCRLPDRPEPGPDGPHRRPGEPDRRPNWP